MSNDVTSFTWEVKYEQILNVNGCRYSIIIVIVVKYLEKMFNQHYALLSTCICIISYSAIPCLSECKFAFRSLLNVRAFLFLFLLEEDCGKTNGQIWELRASAYVLAFMVITKLQRTYLQVYEEIKLANKFMSIDVTIGIFIGVYELVSALSGKTTLKLLMKNMFNHNENKILWILHFNVTGWKVYQF